MNRTHSRGFTLVEVMLAMLIMSLVMASIVGVLHDAMVAKDHIHNVSQVQRTGPLIIDQIEADLRSLAPFNVGGRRVLISSNNSIRGADADTLDMIVSRPGQLEFVKSESGGADNGPDMVQPPILEVGYRLRQNPREPDFLELWRREDPYVDEEPYGGGNFSKLYDKIKSFNLTFYAEPGSSATPEDTWATEEQEVLPQRVEIYLELEIEPRVEATDRLQDVSRLRTFKRIVNLDPDFNRVLLANLRPVQPDVPTADSAGGGAAAPPSSGGPGGKPGGPGFGGALPGMPSGFGGGKPGGGKGGPNPFGSGGAKSGGSGGGPKIPGFGGAAGPK